MATRNLEAKFKELEKKVRKLEDIEDCTDCARCGRCSESCGADAIKISASLKK